MNKCAYCELPCSRKTCASPSCKRKLKLDWQNMNRSPAPQGRKCLFCETTVSGKARQCSTCREESKLKKCKKCRVNRVSSKQATYCQECRITINKENVPKQGKLIRQSTKKKDKFCKQCEVPLKAGSAKRFCSKCVVEKIINRNKGNLGKLNLPEWTLKRGTIRYEGYPNL